VQAFVLGRRGAHTPEEGASKRVGIPEAAGAPDLLQGKFTRFQETRRSASIRTVSS